MVNRSLISIVFAGLLLAWAPQQSAAAAPQGLFGSVEVPAGVPWEWQRVMQRMRQDWRALDACRRDREHCASEPLRAWRDRLDALGRLAPRAQIARINELVNRQPYVADEANFGELDHYASASEFLQKSGDCEDYAIFKYFVLRALGFADPDLRVVLVLRGSDHAPHAVLAVYLGSEVYILDNDDNHVARPQDLGDYRPVQSFNASRGWIHVPS